MHALGFERGKRSGQNFYLSIKGSSEEPLVIDLFKRGFLKPHTELGHNGLIYQSAKSSIFVYSVTDLGIQTITEIVEIRKNKSKSTKQRKIKNGKDQRS